MVKVIINTMGDRITYCRSSLCLTRKDLVEKWNCASVPTLARWELNTVRIPQKKLISLIEFLNNNGLLVTEKWLKDGSGTPPLLLQSNFFNELDFDGIAQEKLLDINRQIKNFIFGQIKNNFMAPFLKYGDYIGGINFFDETHINSIKGELIFLRIKVVGLIVGIIRETIDDILYLYNFEGKIESININQIEALGKIQWIVRRP